MRHDGLTENARRTASLAGSPGTAPGYVFRTYDRAEDIPYEAARAMLIDHAILMHGRMISGGGPDFDYMLHVDAFWEKIDRVLPPNGRYYLVWTEGGDLVGTGSLCKRTDEIGEMKHLYVRPQARGAGLGRELVLRRIEDARTMGFRTLVADTFSTSPEMPKLYDSLGFRRVPAGEVSAVASISPELIDHMLFFRMEL